MILDKEIEIKIIQTKYYIEKGYNVKSGDIIKIPIKDLPIKSDKIVNVECDICKKEYKLSLKKANENISRYNFLTCKKCSSIKIKKTKLEKYNDENYINLDKIKQTKLEKYNDENYNNIEKYKKTCNEKYNCDFYMKTEGFKEKSKITKIKKYGNENYNNIEKYIKTNLKKGYEFPIQNEKIKEKIFENSKLTIKLKNIKKYKNYNIIDYSNGKFIHMCEKGHISVLTRNTLKSRIYYNLNLCKKCYPPYESLIEFTVYNNIKNIYKNKIIRNDRKEIGIELDVFLPELKIAFEINGLYWHSNKFKDKYYHKNKLEKCINKKID